MSCLIKQKLPLFTPSEGKGSAKSPKGSAKSQRSSQNDVDWASLKKNRIYLFSIKQKGKEEMEGKYLGKIRADSLTPSTKPHNSDGNTTEDNIDGKLAEINVKLDRYNIDIESYNMRLHAEPKPNNLRMDNLRSLINSMKQQKKKLEKQKKKLEKQRKKLKKQRTKNLEQRTKSLNMI